MPDTVGGIHSLSLT